MNLRLKFTLASKTWNVLAFSGDIDKAIHGRKIQCGLVKCFCSRFPTHNTFDDGLWQHFENQFFLLSFLLLHIIGFFLNA